MPVGIALIHAEEIAGEQRRLLAAGAGAHFEDGALLVGGVLGQKLHFELPLELLDLGVERVKLLLGERRHLGVGGRVVDELLADPRARAVAACSALIVATIGSSSANSRERRT